MNTSPPRYAQWSGFAILIVIGWCTSGCGELSLEGQREMEHVNFKTGSIESNACVRTLCLTGALDQNSPSNASFKRLCEDEDIPGLILDCGPFGCQSTFDSFLQFPLLTVYPALFETLDTNDDGWVNDGDEQCQLNLIGFSWGGVNALSIAHHLANDQRISQERSIVDKVVLLDAFQPFAEGRMVVPENVNAVLSRRHSEAPSNDCSNRAPMGPYLGFAPACAEQSMCEDFDYSEYPDTVYTGNSGRASWGDEIGHCRIPDVAHSDVIEFINDRATW